MPTDGFYCEWLNRKELSESVTSVVSLRDREVREFEDLIEVQVPSNGHWSDHGLPQAVLSVLWDRYLIAHHWALQPSPTLLSPLTITLLKKSVTLLSGFGSSCLEGLCCPVHQSSLHQAAQIPSSAAVLIWYWAILRFQAPFLPVTVKSHQVLISLSWSAMSIGHPKSAWKWMLQLHAACRSVFSHHL